jgi:hypothetical protein
MPTDPTQPIPGTQFIVCTYLLLEDSSRNRVYTGPFASLEAAENWVNDQPDDEEVEDYEVFILNAPTILS